jgi:hypothetical protein
MVYPFARHVSERGHGHPDGFPVQLALAWSTQEATKPGMGVYWYYKMIAETREQQLEGEPAMIRIKVPNEASHWSLITGRQVAIPQNRIIEVRPPSAAAPGR